MQWTAASGLVHEEFHGRDFARRGGSFEMAQLWVNLPARAQLTLPAGATSALAVLRGGLRAGSDVELESASDATAFLLCGEPIDEPIVGLGPFVMNSPEEIRQAILDFQGGKMGLARPLTAVLSARSRRRR